jgi:alkanesulfonate monooxygenase
LLVSLIARETHAEAVDAAQAIRGRFDDAPRKVHKEFSKRSDSTAFNSTLALAEENQSDWVTPYLWTGLVPFMGAPSIALVGSYDEVADGLMIYQAAGVSQFLFMGWPDLEEMARFHQEVEPRVRKREVERERATVETN